MNSEPACDEGLLQRLPLPLAQLYRRARNAKSSLERHLAAFYLWEAALKLLGAACVVEYARLDRHDDELHACLQNLARPALGHWWDLVRRLVPALADAGAAGFAPLRDLLLGIGHLGHRRGERQLASQTWSGPPTHSRAVRGGKVVGRESGYFS